MADIDNIELRSEKTRQIIGTMPKGIVRYGTAVISLMIIGLLAVSYFVPYIENVGAKAIVKFSDNEILISADIPYLHINSVQEGMCAEIEFEGYPASEYGYCNATIKQIDKRVHQHKGNNYFIAYLIIEDSNGIEIYQGMGGTANILVSKQSLTQKLFSIK